MIDYSFLRELVAIDSPSGFTEQAAAFLVKSLEVEGCHTRRTNKGMVVVSSAASPRLGITAHFDTLGAMVAGITHNGIIRFTRIGGLSLTGAEGESVRIHTMEGRQYTGTILLDNASTHANREKDTTQRDLNNMHIRLDELVGSRFEVERLGISIGDFICLEPRYEELQNGYIKSRFLDNKAGCLILFELAKCLNQSGKPVELYFSNYEEVGHGGTCGYADTIEELLVIDMGVVGFSTMGDEETCSICAKDTSGPYDYEMRRRLVGLAKKNHIPFVQDIYPYYSSDGSAALSAGRDFRIALVGPGVAASHSTERTHKKAIEATFNLCRAYVEDRFP